MTDQKAHLPKVSSGTPHRNGSAHRNPTGQSAAPSRAKTPISLSLAKQSPTPDTKPTNGTPRFRARPAPVRSLSSPLGRSNSMRVSKKERRYSDRLADPKSPTTYKEHFQAPVELSYKLRSLNLETTPSRGGSAGSNGGDGTTYDQSFRWPRKSQFRKNKALTGKIGETSSGDVSKSSARNSSVGNTIKSSDVNVSAVDSSVQASAVRAKSDSRNVLPVSSRDNSSSIQNSSGRFDSGDTLKNSVVTKSVPAPGTSLSVNKDTALERNTVNSSHNSVSAGNKTQASATEKSSSVARPTNGIEARPHPQPISVKSTSQPANGVGAMSQRTSQSHKTANGISGSNIFSSSSDSATPRRNTNNQHRSGGSPFVYGSDSGSWV